MPQAPIAPLQADHRRVGPAHRNRAGRPGTKLLLRKGTRLDRLRVLEAAYLGYRDRFGLIALETQNRPRDDGQCSASIERSSSAKSPSLKSSCGETCQQTTTATLPPPVTEVVQLFLRYVLRGELSNELHGGPLPTIGSRSSVRRSLPHAGAACRVSAHCDGPANNNGRYEDRQHNQLESSRTPTAAQRANAHGAVIVACAGHQWPHRCTSTVTCEIPCSPARRAL